MFSKLEQSLQDLFELKIRELLNTSVFYLCEAELSVKETLLQLSGTEKKWYQSQSCRQKICLPTLKQFFVSSVKEFFLCG